MFNSLEITPRLGESSWLVPEPHLILFFEPLCVKHRSLAPTLYFLKYGFTLLLLLEMI